MDIRLIGYLAVSCTAIYAQAQAPVPAQAAQNLAPPIILTLQDALARAQPIASQILASLTDANAAHEDLLQARGALRPSASFRSDYLGTQGNGVLSSGRFVTNDGVHIYREWGVVHQDFTAAFTKTGPERAAALEALARDRAEIARRGLAVTVTKAYYALLATQRKIATAQLSLDQARKYLEISQNLRRGGEVAGSDVVRAELQTTALELALREAKFAVDQARLDLAVLVFRDFDQDFTLAEDLSQAPALPDFPQVQTLAGRENPEIRAANSAINVAKSEVKIARQAFLPSLTADFAYGIEANAFAFHSSVAAAPDKGNLPNLGYFLTISLNVPVWDWGARKSRVRTAELRRDQATVELSATQRALLHNLQGLYQEARNALEQLNSLQRTVDLAAENLRLIVLRYQSGEATILELVDAQTVQTQARNGYDDGLVRHRLALANLQTLTGTF